MRSTFPGWYRKTDEELMRLWEEAILVPDTNILLHLIRHAPGVRAQLTAIFERKREALWIPYQVGVEFQRNRLDVEHHLGEAYDKLTHDVGASLGQAKDKLRQLRAHPVIDVDREIAALDKHLAEFRKSMSEAKANHPAAELGASFERVTKLLEGRVGPRPSEERLTAIRREGEVRYPKKIPPGFEDAKKGGETGKGGEAGDKHGDLIIWKDMLDKAKAEGKPMILITDDVKEDWWHIHKGRRLGPHPALIEEFLQVTGQSFHIYDLPQFLKFASNEQGVAPETVRQIEETVREEAEARRLMRDEDLDQAIRAEIRTRERERDQMVNTLLRMPSSGGTMEGVDRSGIRDRILTLDREIEELRIKIADVAPDLA